MSDHYLAYLEEERARLRQRLALTEAALARDGARLHRVLGVHQGCTADTCTTIAAIEEES